MPAALSASGGCSEGHVLRHFCVLIKRSVFVKEMFLFLIIQLIQGCNAKSAIVLFKSHTRLLLRGRLLMRSDEVIKKLDAHEEKLNATLFFLAFVF